LPARKVRHRCGDIMSCPDEDTFARLQAGLLSHAESANVHLHLDSCPACLELAGILGSIRDSTSGPNGAEADFEKRVQAGPLRKTDHSNASVATGLLRSKANDCVLAQGALTLAHGYFAIAMVPIFWQGLTAEAESASILSQLGSMRLVVSTYVVVWGLAGFLWALLGCAGLLTTRRWTYTAVAGYALLSIPSILLAPLAGCVLVALRRQEVARPPRDARFG
jgi:hypothetical protein